MNDEKMYMDIRTGEVGNYDDWFYEDLLTGEEVNAVDRGEVVEVKDDGDGFWVVA